MNSILSSSKFKQCTTVSSQLSYFQYTGLLEQSPNDYRTHALLRLSNDLIVVCTEDAKAEKATAALGVNVGSYSDPTEMPGLAHCLEHLVYLDHKKFSQCISKYNGTRCVSGGGSYTNYTFTVENGGMEETLEQFVQLFIHPQFKNVELDCTNCEMLGTRKYLQAFNKFGKSASYDVLSLSGFFSNYYLANVMKLVITANYSLEKLISWVVEKFSGIPNKKITLPVFESHLFAKLCIGKLATIESVDCNNRIDLVFATPGTNDKYVSSPSYYASCILKEKKRGSLLHYLQTNGWATNFEVVKHYDEHNGFSLFKIVINATLEGIDNYEQVIEITMGYLDKISVKTPKKWVFNKCHDAFTIEYNYIHSDDSVSWCVELANDLHNPNLLPEHVLSRDKLVRDFSPEESLEYFTHINSTNYSAIIYSRNSEISKTKLSLVDLPSSLSTHVSVANDVLQKFCLPDRFDKKHPVKSKYKKKGSSETKVMLKNASGSRLLVKNDNVEVWFNRNESFLRSRGTIIAEIQFPKSSNAPQTIVLTELFCQYANATIGDELYQTPARGCKFKLSRGNSSIVIFIDWFSEKLVGILNKIVHLLTNLVIEDVYFETYRSSLISEYNDKLDKQPHQIAEFYQAYIVYGHIEIPSDIVDALKSVDVTMLHSFSQSIFASTYTRMIISGYVDEIYAHAGAHIIEAKLNSIPLHPLEKPKVSTCCFEPGYLVFKVPAGNGKTSVSGLSSHIYCGQQSQIRDKALCHMISRIINNSNQYSREKKEYFIRASCLPFIHKKCILALTIQGVGNPAYLTKCLNIMMDKVKDLLTEITEEELESYADDQIEQLLETSNMCSVETKRLWDKIDNGTYDFYENKNVAREISTLSKSDIIEFWDKYVAHKTAVDYTRIDCQIWSSHSYQPTDQEVEMYASNVISLHGCLYSLGITDISISVLNKIIYKTAFNSKICAEMLVNSIIDSTEITSASKSILKNALEDRDSAVIKTIEIAISESDWQPSVYLPTESFSSTTTDLRRTPHGIWFSSNISNFKQTLLFNQFSVPIKDYAPEESEF